MKLSIYDAANGNIKQLSHSGTREKFDEQNRKTTCMAAAQKKTKFRGLSPRANYTDRATAAWQRT
jgi:hypothetical protein